MYEHSESAGLIEPHKAGLPAWALAKLPRHSLRIVLDHVRSAYNVGALFRTADGAGVDRLILVGYTPHPPHPALEKTALGATTYVPWQHRESAHGLGEELEENGYQLVALENCRQAHDIWDFSWPERAALVAGNELEGISSSLLASCQHRIRIPMFGYKASMNVTTALAIAMFDYIAKRRDKL